jgi:histidine ammonia-lyase
LTLSDVQHFLKNKIHISISQESKNKVNAAHQVVKRIIDSDQPVYGVNTGFGKFSEVRIDRNKLIELQKRLVYSHAAGTGDPLPLETVHLIMLLKIKSLSLGHSGCRLEVINQLIGMVNKNIIPVIPQKGSVGASGDLSPLAHMALVMMGEGNAFVLEKKNKNKWRQIDGGKALKQNGLKPLKFDAKEGLAVLNGTQVSTAIALRSLLKAKQLSISADIIGSITLEALLGTLTPFDARFHKIRIHPGQRTVASNVRKLLAEMRCIPQVHGAIRDSLTHVERVLIKEINSVTDNPLIFADRNDVLSGGNFHAAPVSYVCDLMSIVLSDLASISERRIEHMQDPNVSLLPAFLTASGGLNSGFMIAHVTAAALTSENKVLSHPASVDSIPTSANKEDHVSMATHAARKAAEISINLQTILAIELLSACQALDLRAPLTPAKATAAALDLVRTHIPFWKEDRQIYKDMEIACELISSGELINSVEKVCGQLK